jgi:hypothetical protein
LSGHNIHPLCLTTNQLFQAPGYSPDPNTHLPLELEGGVR